MPQAPGPAPLTDDELRTLVQKCLSEVLRAGDVLPPDQEDWIESGLLDSMALVDVLLSVEKAAGLPGFLDRQEGRPPRCTVDAVAALRAALAESSLESVALPLASTSDSGPLVNLSGWGVGLGGRRVDAGVVEAEFSLSPGTLTERAGIQSVVRVLADESELSLAEQAALAALSVAEIDASEVDFILATSETFLALPSLGASLHSRLLAKETCGVLDVGGACVGLVNALGVASALIKAGAADCTLVVSSDVHSRRLAPGAVDGTFGGLFGDAASAFVLQAGVFTANEDDKPYFFGPFSFGCDGAYADALTLSAAPTQPIELRFEGEALARAAVRRLARVIAEVESSNGLSRRDASGFALHQPNPRLVPLLAKEAGIPMERIPLVAQTSGNLGSSTVGVALASILARWSEAKTKHPGPIFLAAVGPGLLSGGGVLR
jgi:3-oxoacyl-[acyl-carrier-protein] synthase-3